MVSATQIPKRDPKRSETCMETWRNRYVAKRGITATFDDRQITHLICVRLKHLLYDFFRGRFGPLI